MMESNCPSTSGNNRLYQEERSPTMTTNTRCKTADLIGNLRRKGYKYFNHSDEDENSDQEEEEEANGTKKPGSKDEDAASSNSSEYDEVMICNVCDRSFRTLRQLIQHQSTKRHFECSVCHQLFPSLVDVKSHKESMAHWTPEDNHSNVSIDRLVQLSMAQERRGSQITKISTAAGASSLSSSSSADPPNNFFPCDERLL